MRIFWQVYTLQQCDCCIGTAIATIKNVADNIHSGHGGPVQKVTTPVSTDRITTMAGLGRNICYRRKPATTARIIVVTEVAVEITGICERVVVGGIKNAIP